MEPILEKNKLNKGFKTTFVINCIPLLIVILLSLYLLVYQASNIGMLEILELLSVGFVLIAVISISFLASLFFLIVTTILGIVNYKKSRKKEIRRKIIIMLSSIIIIHIIIIGGYGFLITSNNDGDTTAKLSEVILNERQKSILEDEELSTNYNELTYAQKKAIVAIEEMLQVVEKKYGIEFSYSGYTAKGMLNEEQLWVYPTIGGSEMNSFTVTKKDENGKIYYEDNYINVASEEFFCDYVSEFIKKDLGIESVKVYAMITSTTLESVPKEFSEFDGTTGAKVWVFIDESSFAGHKMDDFINSFNTWLKEHNLSVSTQVIILKTGTIKYLTKYNFTDYLSEEYYNQKENFFQ